jgi:two-component system OmpR family sensor kinase
MLLTRIASSSSAAPWPRTLRARLTLWYTGLFTAMLACLGALALLLLDRALRESIDASLDTMANSIAATVREPAPFDRDLEQLLESTLGPQLAERFFRLLDPFGRPDPRLATRGRIALPLSIATLRNAEQGRPTYETIRVPANAAAPIRVLTKPIVEQGRVIRLVQVAVSLDSAQNARSRFLLVLLGLAPLAIGGAGLGGWFLARRALAPVDAMVDAARRIEAEDLSRRLDAPGTADELGRLGAVLNDMLARLQQSFTAVRQFSADAAHELRTPLTILKGEIEVALRSAPGQAEYQRVLASCLEEVDRLATLVEDMLFLARSDSGAVALPQTDVDLAGLLMEVAAPLRALADASGIELSVATDGQLDVAGSRSMLFRAFFNLGENAIKYTPAGGRVTITLRRDGSESLVEVCDTGPGISATERERIFDRFYRGDPARSRGGTGLGLALVRSIVTLHGGRIIASSTAAGACFRVSLPLMKNL